MASELEVGVRITADGKGLVGETQAAKQALGGLGDAGHKAGSGLNQAAKQSDALEASTSRLKSGLIAATGAYLSLGAAIGGAKAVMEAAIANERLHNSLTVGLGSLKAAKDEMAFLRQESDRLGLQLDTTAQQYSKLAVSAKGTALEGQAIRDVFLGVAQASTVLGLSAADTGGVLTAVEQIISKGKVSAEELRGQLGERLPGAFQMAARAIGVTTAELDAMLAKGELTAEQLLPALARELNTTFGPQAEQAAQGLNAQINRFNTALFDLKVAIGETGLIDFLSSGIQLATRLANAMAGVFGASANLSAIDKQRQMISGLREELVSLNDRKNIPLIGDLLFDKRSADLLSQRIDDAVADLARMEQAAASETNALKNETVALQTVNQSLQTETKTKKEAVSEATRFIQALTKEIESVGKDAIELKRLEAARLGVLKTAAPLIDALERETRALEEQEKTTRKREEDLRQIAQITESVMTGQEKYAARVKELDRLLAQGLGQETYNRALRQAEEQFLKTGRAGRDALDEISQFAIQAQRNLQNALGDALFDGINGRFDDMFEGFKNALLRMLTEAAAADILGALFGKPTGNLSSVLGLLGGAGSGSGSMAQSALNLFNTGFGATRLIGSLGNVMPGSIGAFFSGMGGGAVPGISSQAALMGSSFGAVAGPLMANAVAVGLGSMIGGDKKLFGMNSTITSTVGAVLGGPVGAIIGGGLNALFGRGPYKFRQEVLEGTASAAGFDGEVTDIYRSKGGLFMGNKHKERVSPNEEAFLELFDSTLRGFASSTRQFATTLGLDATSINSYSKEIKLESEKGKRLTEEAIQQMLVSIGDDFARGVLPQIDALARSGESAYQTLQRITGEFDVLTHLGAALGNSLAETRAFLRGVSIEDRSAFVEQAGGTDVLSQNIAYFSQNFLSEAERLAPIIETVTDKMAELGLSGIQTKEQFRDLVQSQDLTTESGRKMFLELMNIQGSFLIVANAAEAAETAVDSLIPKLDVGGLLNDALGSLQRSVDAERKTVVKNYNDSLKQINTEISHITDSVNKLRSLADGLKSTVASIRGLTVSEAQQQIAAAIASARKGIFPDLDKIQPALQALQGQTAFGFRTREDFERARATNANLVAELGDLADDQLDSQQRMLDELERGRSILQEGFDREIARLDGILESARQEADALLGLNTVLLSLTDALKNFNMATGAAVDSGKTTAHPATVLGGAGNSAISAKEIRDFILSGKSDDEVLQAALQHKISAQQVADAMKGHAGYSMDDIRRFTASRGITGFASGGFHSGGVRIVGELGPELEMTGPSRIFSNQQTKDLLGSSEIVAAIKELIVAVNDDIKHNKQTADLLLRVTRDGESLRTVAA